MAHQRLLFLVGLFLTTLATLALEILDTRLLSVLTWYHLSFLAVSLAMLGMAAGAVRVYLGGRCFEGDAAPASLVKYSVRLALFIPASHLVNLSIPIVAEISVNSVLALALSTVALAVPFYCSGVVVALALTRIPGRIGLVYGVDLLGAAAGTLLALLLVGTGSITSAVLLVSVIAAAAAVGFAASVGQRAVRGPVGLTVLLAVFAALNLLSSKPLRIAFPKGIHLPAAQVLHEDWSINGHVVTQRPRVGSPPYWGAGNGATEYRAETIRSHIDGAAGTWWTRWNGDRRELDWVGHDLTSLPYHLRPEGDVAVIGVGGGRDILAALWAKSRSVTGVEVNRAFIDLHRGLLLDFARIAQQPEVSLVHDEARSYLTRTRRRFDVLQMSLIDTWAATGAGAFTLSENGLYTVEAWAMFLSRLKPDGLFSVSRWYASGDVSETSRMVSLGTAALLRAGARRPRLHLAAYSRSSLATLLISKQPLQQQDLADLRGVCQALGFEPLLVPGEAAASPLLDAIASSRSMQEIQDAVADAPYDYTPPTDARPYFFNVVKPASSRVLSTGLQPRAGIVAGNLLATGTLGLLLLLVSGLVVAVIAMPLLRRGLPGMGRSAFAWAGWYFASIGTGFMLLQVCLMQRFSVYLGHPTYALTMTLFSMILATGLGSLLSEKLAVERRKSWLVAVPLMTTLAILLIHLFIQSVMDRTLTYGLVARSAVTIATVAPVSVLLGAFFPAGVRLVEQVSRDATAWMWGINGAFGVLASVVAVFLSMWVGIHANLVVALVVYGLVAWPAWRLWRLGRV
jgi:hypothetical protein